MVRFQLQVRDKNTQTSHLFDDMMHIPRKGEEFTIFEEDTGDVICEGIVERVQWSVIESGYTVTVTIDPR